MKGAKFRNEGFYSGYARCRFEPLAPSPHLIRGTSGYRLQINGHAVPWMCYCQQRYHWLIGTLVKQGVNVRHFSGKSRRIPRRKCQEISTALQRLRDNGYQGYERDRQLLDVDINFYAHCGGVRIHPWASYSEIFGY